MCWKRHGFCSNSTVVCRSLAARLAIPCAIHRTDLLIRKTIKRKPHWYTELRSQIYLLHYLLIVSHLFSLIIHDSDSQHQLFCIIIIKYNIQIISKSSCYLLSNLKQENIFAELLMIVSSCAELQIQIATISFDFKLIDLHIYNCIIGWNSLHYVKGMPQWTQT